MKKTTFQAFAIISLLLTTNALPLFAQGRSSPDGVVCITNTTLLQRGGELTVLNDSMDLSSKIKVFTNCTYKVNDGKERDLATGQTLRADGFLLNADGSIRPVADHVEVNNGAVTVFKDGKGTRLSSTLTLSDGSTVDPDGSYTRPGGRGGRLRDGQLLTLEGASLPGLDTITLRGGKVTIYRSGALVTLQDASQITGMYDGTKVRGDGFLIGQDGTATPLKEGETVTVPGLRAEW